MTKYFENFPIIEYDGRRVRDITRRSQFKKDISLNPYLYMPYTVKESERAEDIAQFYYGSTDYTWLVYFSNNIIDPAHDWPMSETNFNNYLIEKYGEESGEVGEDVVDWTRRQDIDSNILYYYKEV
jgi:hypothetical protein